MYFALLLFIANHLPSSVSKELNQSIVVNLTLAFVFYAFLSFIFGTIGEFLEFSTNGLKTVYAYLALLSLASISLAISHLLGDMSIITGVATSGLPIAGMVLFETKKVLRIFIVAVIVYAVITVLTFNQVLRYAPLIENTTYYESNVVWSVLVLAMAIPNIILLSSVSMSSVIRWKQREGQATYLAQKDVLTHANNRRYALELMAESIKNTCTNKTPLCVLMLDIDHFKKVNDVYGHLVGDKVIIHVSNLIEKHLPKLAFHGRYGGEEFCIVMPHSEIEQAQTAAETIRDSIEKTPFIAEGKKLDLSVSIGITLFDGSEVDDHVTIISDQLLLESDRAMYDVKKGGRNGVKVYQQTEAT